MRFQYDDDGRGIWTLLIVVVIVSGAVLIGVFGR